MRGDKGLTLIELLIVLAIIAIIGAVLVPNFLGATDKARLKSDIQSARVLGNAIGLYNAEQTAGISVGASADVIIEKLEEKGYIEEDIAHIQTENAEWNVDAATGGITVDISKCSEAIRQIASDQLTLQEQKYVKD